MFLLYYDSKCSAFEFCVANIWVCFIANPFSKYFLYWGWKNFVKFVCPFKRTLSTNDYGFYVKTVNEQKCVVSNEIAWHVYYFDS